MKTFLYIASSTRSGIEDATLVIGGSHYNHRQLLLAIDAVDHEHAARALGLTITSTFDRSSVGCPNMYSTNQDQGFSLFLKELESGDCISHKDLNEKIRLKVTAT